MVDLQVFRINKTSFTFSKHISCHKTPCFFTQKVIRAKSSPKKFGHLT